MLEVIIVKSVVNHLLDLIIMLLLHFQWRKFNFFDLKKCEENLTAISVSELLSRESCINKIFAGLGRGHLDFRK